MDFFKHGISETLQTAQTGSIDSVPDLPSTDADATAQYIQAVLNQQLPVPAPIRLQVDHILQALKSL
jgi:hypothetical protein